MPFNGKESGNVTDQIDCLAVPFTRAFLSLTLLLPVVHFLSSLSLDDGTTQDTNQMLLNPPCNQPRITTPVPTRCSVTSSRQGRDEEREDAVNENNIDDNQQRREERDDNADEEEAIEDAPAHNADVGSTNIAVLRSVEEKPKHYNSSSTLLPPLIPRSSSTVATTSMLRQHRRPRHDTYRTLQLPVNSANRLLIIQPDGAHQPVISATASSENNLQRTGTRLHSSLHNQHNRGNSCFNEESVRTLSRGKLIAVITFFGEEEEEEEETIAN